MRSFLIFTTLFFLVACGSGEVSVISPVDDLMEEGAPETAEEPKIEERFDCFVYDEDTLRKFLEDVYTPTTPFIIDYYESNSVDVESLCDGRVNRWTQPPTVRIGGMPEYERRFFPEIIDRINKSLPDEYDIKIGEDVSVPVIFPPRGEIHVYISPRSGWPRAWPNVAGYARYTRPQAQVFPVSWGVAAALPSTEPEEVQGTARMRIIQHEFLHVLFGTFCHVRDEWPTILNLRESEAGKISRIELDALRALHLHMKPRDYADTLRIPEEEMCGD